MEIVNIDVNTFEKILSKFEHFSDRTEALCGLYGEKDISEWPDNQDVCRLLNISSRTLQTLRDNGMLTKTQISHKIYYKPEDVQKILPLIEEKHQQAKYRGKRL